MSLTSTAHHSFKLVLCLFLILPCCSTLLSLPNAKPVPRMQVIPLPYNQVSFQRDGKEIARYHFGPSLKRPFIFPVIGPSGRSLTRMGHPHDPATHSHQNSVWISHRDINGTNFWEDGDNPARIRQEKISRLEDGQDEASISVINGWFSETGKQLMREHRRITIKALPGREFLLILDLEFFAEKEKVIIGKTPFGMIGVRMAKTIGVNDGGGMIRNSEGDVNEHDVFRKHAKWVDYSGPIKTWTIEGITLMDYPANPNYPAPFHVRNDGWMGACLSLDGRIIIKQGSPLHLRYGLYIHSGMPSKRKIQEKWNEFAGKAAKLEFNPRRVVKPFKPIKSPHVIKGKNVKDEVTDQELVLGVVVKGIPRAYPINMLTGPVREIINDRLGGEDIAATW